MKRLTVKMCIAATALAVAPPLAGYSKDSAEMDTEADVGDVGVLYAAEGADITYLYCTACHSEMLVAQQGQTREGWDHLLQWMVEKQGMQPIPDDDRDIILDYLAKHYNTDRPHFPQ